MPRYRFHLPDDRHVDDDRGEDIVELARLLETRQVPFNGQFVRINDHIIRIDAIVHIEQRPDSRTGYG